MAELVDAPTDDVPPERWGGFHPVAVVAVIAGVLAVYRFGRYRFELLLAVLVLLVLVTLYNVVYALCGRALRVPVEEFAVGFGGGLGAFRAGRTRFQMGWLPFGSYVKFPGQDPFDRRPPPPLRPGERYFHDVHPLHRAALTLSAPAALTLLGLALLAASGKVDILEDVKRAFASVSHSGPLALARQSAEAWLRSFTGPGGVVRGAGMTAAYLGLLNLMPAPVMSGGVALSMLVEWMSSRRFTGRWFTPVMMILTLPVVAVAFCFLIGLVQVVFGAP